MVLIILQEWWGLRKNGFIKFLVLEFHFMFICFSFSVIIIRLYTSDIITYGVICQKTRNRLNKFSVLIQVWLNLAWGIASMLRNNNKKRDTIILPDHLPCSSTHTVMSASSCIICFYHFTCLSNLLQERMLPVQI